jgi:hypothetical protein
LRPHTRRSLTRAAAAATAATAATVSAPVLPGVTGITGVTGVGDTGIAQAAAPAAAPTLPPAAPAPQRIARSRRPAKDVATDLRTRLAAYEDSRRRSGPGQGNGRRLLTELSQASKEALTDLEGQLHGGTSPIYWAASIIRDAVAANDEPSLARAARYLDAALRPAG